MNQNHDPYKNYINQSYQAFLAPAKINLFLHVVGKRSDGYHLLQTVFQLLDFYDTIYLKTTTDGRISRLQAVENISESSDLCVRAATALKEYALQTSDGALSNVEMLGIDIAYDKRIPMGGGLGGGSSDAATVLIALNKLWQLNFSRQTLMRIGLKLGADVPVFVFGQNAWAEGVGEVLQTINLPQTYYVVVTPQVHVATAQIFKEFSNRSTNRLNSSVNSKMSLTKHTNPMTIADFSRAPHSETFNNDLERVVCEDYLEVASTLNWLKQFGLARMSGSGSSVFISVDSVEKAEYILQQKPSNTTGFVAKNLNTHPLFEMTATS